MPYHRVLVATDLSEDAAVAARFARHLLAPGAKVRFAHVMPEPDPRAENEEGLLDARREEMHEAIVAWARKHARASDADVVLLEGGVVDGIANAASEFHADLVVLGARGQSRLAKTLLGSKARGAVRRVSCDTLVCHERESPDAALSALVVPTDFHEPAKRAARRAVDLAGAKNASLVLCHVIDQDMWRSAVYDAPGVEKWYGDAEWLEKASRDMLKQFHAEVVHHEVQARDVVRRGRPAHEVAKLAREEDAQLIVVGTHGPGRIERALLGSVAESIVESAPCPVLVVRT